MKPPKCKFCYLKQFKEQVQTFHASSKFDAHNREVIVFEVYFASPYATHRTSRVMFSVALINNQSCTTSTAP